MLGASDASDTRDAIGRGERQRGPLSHRLQPVPNNCSCPTANTMSHRLHEVMGMRYLADYGERLWDGVTGPDFDRCAADVMRPAGRMFASGQCLFVAKHDLDKLGLPTTCGGGARATATGTTTPSCLGH